MKVYHRPVSTQPDPPQGPLVALESLVVRLVHSIMFAENTCSIQPLTGGGKSKISPFTSPIKLKFLSQSVYLLNTIHRIHVLNRQVNQRELFYRSLGDPMAPAFGDQTNMNRALISLMNAVDCDRHELGIFTTARGLVAADPSVETVCLDQDGEFLCNLSHHTDGLSITETVVSSICTIQTNAECVLVVEKDTVFQSLIRTKGFFEINKCIVVTARGFPDNLTLRFLKRLVEISNNEIPVMYLGDLDPHGISISLIYYRALDERLKWIGVHASDIQALQFESMVGMKMTSTDTAVLSGLIEKSTTPDFVKEELGKLESRGLKYEVEALHSVSENYLALEWLPQKINSSVNLPYIF
jgi:meiotic recombination protein SPO11